MVDAGGHTLLVGSSSDAARVTFTSVDGPTSVLEYLPSEGVFLARYGPMGALHWARVVERGYNARVAADESGNALVASVYESDLCLSRYRTDGSLDWTVTARGTESATYRQLGIADLQVTPDGDAVAVGRFNGLLTFGSGDDSVTLDAETERHAFVAQYLSNGLLGEAIQLEVAGEWSLGDAALRP